MQINIENKFYSSIICIQYIYGNLMRFKYNILIFIIGIIINIAFTYIVLILKIPFLFMDSIGTILIAIIVGPTLSAIAGLITNIITSITIDYINLHFAIVNVLIGLIIGIIAKKYDFKILKIAIISGLIVGIISGLISTAISIALTNGLTTRNIDKYIQALINSGKSLIISTAIGTLPAAIIDKVVSCIMVSIAIKKILLFKINDIDNDCMEK